MKKELKKSLLLCLGVTVCLTACRNAGQPETGAGTGIETEVETETGTSAGVETPAETDLSKAAEEAEPEYEQPVAAGWQFAPGYGIFGPNQPVVYGLAQESGQTAKETGRITKETGRTTEETEGADVELVSAFYQDGHMNVRIKIRDYSVTLIPDDEVEELLKKEEENRKLQEEGGNPEWDNSYFCLDEEKRIYGRSAFRDVAGGQAGGETFERIRGAGISDSGYSFNSSSSTNRYEEFLEKGYYTTVMEGNISNRQFHMKEPEGMYELTVNGFENPLTFSFAKVQEYDEPGEMAGTVEHDGFYSLAQAEITEEGTRVSVYTYPADGYQLSPGTGTLTYKMEDGTTQEAVPDMNMPVFGGRRLEPGIDVGGYSERFYRLPKDGNVESASYLITKPWVISDEESEEIVIPVPEGEEILDEKIEFRDCILYLTGIKRLDERYDYGTDANNQKITKPLVYVSARVENKTEDKFFEWIKWRQADARGGEEKNPYDSVVAAPEFTEGKAGEQRELKGFKVPYEEEAEELRVQFQEPQYIWDQEFALPID